MSCSAVFCSARTTKGGVKDPDLSFHTFPKCPKIRSEWIKAVRRDNWKPTKYSRLCSKHFDKSCYIAGLSMKKLNTDAVPTIFERYPTYYQPLPNDMENYSQYKVTGSEHRIKMRSDCGSSFEVFTHKSKHSPPPLHPQSDTSKVVSWEQKMPATSDLQSDNIKAVTKREPPDESPELCNWCNGSTSRLFVCVQCNARACTCDARGAHASHFVLGAPVGSLESELQLAINKVREALVSIGLIPITELSEKVPEIGSQTYTSHHVTDDEFRLPEEPEYELIKMEVKVEEEMDIQSVPALNQSLTWDPYGVALGTSYLAQHKEEAMSTASSVTLTASPSDFSSSDSDETDSERPQVIWTDQMNRQLIRFYNTLTLTEKRKSRVYSRLKKAFTLVFPHIKVTRSQLREQRKIICKKKLLSEQVLSEIQKVVYSEIKTKNFQDASIKPIESTLSTVKGRQLVLSKVTSGVQNNIPDTQNKIPDTQDKIPDTQDKIPDTQNEIPDTHYLTSDGMILPKVKPKRMNRSVYSMEADLKLKRFKR